MLDATACIQTYTLPESQSILDAQKLKLFQNCIMSDPFRPTKFLWFMVPTLEKSMTINNHQIKINNYQEPCIT